MGFAKRVVLQGFRRFLSTHLLSLTVRNIVLNQLKRQLNPAYLSLLTQGIRFASLDPLTLKRISLQTSAIRRILL